MTLKQIIIEDTKDALLAKIQNTDFSKEYSAFIEVPLDTNDLNLSQITEEVREASLKYDVPENDISINIDEDSNFILSFRGTKTPTQEEILVRQKKMFSSNFSIYLAKTIKDSTDYKIRTKRSSRDAQGFPSVNDPYEIFEQYFDYFIEEIA